MANSKILNELFDVIDSRKKSDDKDSYTAKLFGKGREKIAQKLGEEAVEVVIDAIADKKSGVVYESADLLYHLLVLWSDMGIDPEKIWKELEKRRKTNNKKG